MIRAQAPGKLFIAGEYAVVEPGEPAVLVAVDRHIVMELEASRGRGSISSDQYGREPLGVDPRRRCRRDRPGSPPLRLCLRGDHDPRAADRRTRHRTAVLRSAHLSSELDDVSGRKFGLGSSAAVTVATVRALEAFYDLGLSAMEVFKLALIATVRVSPAASGGDLAASAFGRLDRLQCAGSRAGARRGGDAAHPGAVGPRLRRGLSVRRLPPPWNLRLLVGWTGRPASTTSRGQRAAPQAGRRSRIPRVPRRQPCRRRSAGGRPGRAGCRRGDVGPSHAPAWPWATWHGRRDCRSRRLCCRHCAATAVLAGAAAKSSGAGGGDCGIVLAPADADLRGLLAEWERRHPPPRLRVQQPAGVIHER